MTDSDWAKEKISVALTRLEQVVENRLVAVAGQNESDELLALRAEIDRLQNENKNLRELARASTEKLDVAILRINDMIRES